jgi:hypothetical protein
MPLPASTTTVSGRASVAPVIAAAVFARMRRVRVPAPRSTSARMVADLDLLLGERRGGRAPS